MGRVLEVEYTRSDVDIIVKHVLQIAVQPIGEHLQSSEAKVKYVRNLLIYLNLF